MSEILLTTLYAVISRVEGWQDVENLGKSKINFLKKYLPFNNGIPSDDTFHRFFKAIDLKKFQENFLNFSEFKKSEIIVIDGKTSRLTHDKDKKSLHLISAFANEARIAFCQKKVDGKTNEISEIPELLNWLELQGSIAIDAMGSDKNSSANNKSGRKLFISS